jgi:hypothetical protein
MLSTENITLIGPAVLAILLTWPHHTGERAGIERDAPFQVIRNYSAYCKG